jgi:hypothetical protein
MEVGELLLQSYDNNNHLGCMHYPFTSSDAISGWQVTPVKQGKVNETSHHMIASRGAGFLVG